MRKFILLKISSVIFLSLIILTPQISSAQFFNLGAFWRNRNIAPPNYGVWTTKEYDPMGVERASAVWTGTEMLVFGGSDGDVTNRGYKYNPTSDTWTRLSTTSVPEERSRHTAVWTGTEMIVWGGYGKWGRIATGGKYNPTTDTWTATNTATAPAARYDHTAVWTGTVMVIWGGYTSGPTQSGSRYVPSTDGWSITLNDGTTPTARYGHTAVWTGTEMIVWGGGREGTTVSTGGKYDPGANTWTATLNDGTTPVKRIYHTAVWTGTEMIVWGGKNDSNTALDTGGKYNPSTNVWAATSIGTNKPVARFNHAAVWADTEMIVWGGYDGTTGGYLDSGGRYTPGTDAWATVSGSGAPEKRAQAVSVWTGTEMIVWGGVNTWKHLSSGGKYNPSSDSWTATNEEAAVAGGEYSEAVWTGTEMLIYGEGNLTRQGYKYNYATDTWTPMSTTNAPSIKHHTVVWTGTEMIVWGGFNSSGNNVNTGARYNPSTDTWTATSTGANVPAVRRRHTAVWTGTEMIIWGGYDTDDVGLDTGARYNPSTDTWTAVTSSNAPDPRYWHSAIWTGTDMIVYGGESRGFFSAVVVHNNGAKYNPTTNTWTTIANSNVDRRSFAAVWTGTEMIVWGGRIDEGLFSFETYTNKGEKYNPTTNTWTNIVDEPALAARMLTKAVWTGTEMIIWGGEDAGTSYSTGARYNPTRDRWMIMTNTDAPRSRSKHIALAIGDRQMLVFGGSSSTGISRENSIHLYTILLYCTSTYNQTDCDALTGCSWNGTTCENACSEHTTQYGCTTTNACAWAAGSCS